MSLQTPKLRIITVGGSLAGLTASIALQRLGHQVTIFERSPTPLLHDQGAGIVAGGEVRDFLTRHDRTQTTFSVASHERLYLDRKGDITRREKRTQHMTGWDVLYHIFRANYDGCQSEYVSDEGMSRLKTDAEPEVKPGYYEYGRQVTEITPMGDQIRISWRSTLPNSDKDIVQYSWTQFVIIADGPSSSLRKALSPSSPERKYAGYVAFRGTVRESKLSAAAGAVFVEKFPFFHADGIQILAYTIPGHAAAVRPGDRTVNWVWYHNVAEDSDEYREIMTDKHGASHRWTLPPGDNMAPAVWERQKQRARETLPPQFAELVDLTEAPFVQAVTDLEPPADGKVWVLDGKAVLVGDSVAGFRPHTAASTGQAAKHALLLEEVFGGRLSREDYEQEVMSYATEMQKHGVQLGNRSQFGHHPLASR